MGTSYSPFTVSLSPPIIECTNREGRFQYGGRIANKKLASCFELENEVESKTRINICTSDSWQRNCPSVCNLKCSCRNFYDNKKFFRVDGMTDRKFVCGNVVVRNDEIERQGTAGDAGRPTCDDVVADVSVSAGADV